jgi:hypothetical protein
VLVVAPAMMMAHNRLAQVTMMMTKIQTEAQAMEMAAVALTLF